MHVFLLGVSHHTAPVDLRERLDFSSRDLGEAVKALAAAPAGRGRAAVHVQPLRDLRGEQRPEQARTEIVGFLAAYHELPRERCVPHLFERDDMAAAPLCFAWPPASTRSSSVSRRFSARSRTRSRRR